MRYQSTTGLPADVIQEIVAGVHDVAQGRGLDVTRHRITLYQQVVICLMLLVFTHGGLEEAIEQGHLLLVDGTHVPTGNRPASGQAAANYSGKRRVQCLNIQVASTSRGHLVAVSDPFPGARHDARVIQECGWSDILAEMGACWIADSAYIATNAITPVKKTPASLEMNGQGRSPKPSLVSAHPSSTASPSSKTGKSSPKATADASKNSPPSSESSPNSNSSEPNNKEPR